MDAIGSRIGASVQHNGMLYGLANGNANGKLNIGNNANANNANGNTNPSQTERLLTSRASASPHHHARIAAAAARTMAQTSNLNLAAVAAADQTITSATISNGSNRTNGSNASINAVASTQSLVDPRAEKWTVLDLGGMHIRNLSSAIFKYSFLTTLYLNHNNLMYLSHNVILLKCLTILDLSGNKLSTVPPELGSVVSLKELLLFDNQITYLPVELGALYQLEIFGLEGNPLPDQYMNFLQKEGALSIISYLKELLPEPQPPLNREWITVDDSFSQSEANAFTVLCYNTLCDKYATSQVYPYTPAWVLSWENRKELILSEILSYHADIVCLQEVETSQFEEFFQERLLEATDYQGVFWPKSRARTMGEYERRAVDGCATFFRTSKFTLVEKYTIEFQQIAMQRPELRRTEDVFNRVMVKDNIGLIAVLESKDHNNHYKLIVANTHLHWDPSDSDVKLVQTAMLLEELNRIIALHSTTVPVPGSTKPAVTPPVIVCGDFNSLPNSGVHELLNTGSVPRDHPDFKKYTYGAYTREGITHGFGLRSAYDGVSELEFTNYTPAFRGVLDYIFCSQKDLVVTHLLGNVDREYVKAGSGVVGFPNVHHPSDHVPIMAAMWYKGAASATEGNGNSMIGFGVNEGKGKGVFDRIKK